MSAYNRLKVDPNRVEEGVWVDVIVDPETEETWRFRIGHSSSSKNLRAIVRKMSFGRKPSFERGRARKGKADDAEPATVPAIRPPDGSAVSLSDLLPEPQTTPERSRGLVDFLNAKEGLLEARAVSN